MRAIKFRGRVVGGDKYDGEKIVSGSLAVYATGMYSHWIYTEGAERNYPVEPESVAQMVGYDRDGRKSMKATRSSSATQTANRRGMNTRWS